MSALPTSSQFSSSLSSSSAPSSTSTSNGNTLNSSSPSSLLFSFLITVLSLFGLFMISGLLWHRLVIRRRMIDEMLRINIPSQRRELQKPRLWDVWALLAQGFPQWWDIQPFAVEKQEMTSPPPLDSQTPRTSLWKRVINLLPREITYLLYPPPLAQVVEYPLLNYSTIALPLNNSDVQVSLFIAMPQRPVPPSHSSKDVGLEKQGLLDEIVIGTTNVHYHDPGSQ